MRAAVGRHRGTRGAHLNRRPLINPVSLWRAAFPAHIYTLLECGNAFFHLYSFNLKRQIGANFEFLPKYLSWLSAQGFAVLASIATAAQSIASELNMQFSLAPAIAGERRDSCEDCFDVLESAYEKKRRRHSPHWCGDALVSSLFRASGNCYGCAND
jgi:hypothetical protein